MLRATLTPNQSALLGKTLFPMPTFSTTFFQVLFNNFLTFSSAHWVAHTAGLTHTQDEWRVYVFQCFSFRETRALCQQIWRALAWEMVSREGKAWRCAHLFFNAKKCLYGDKLQPGISKEYWKWCSGSVHSLLSHTLLNPFHSHMCTTLHARASGASWVEIWRLSRWEGQDSPPTQDLQISDWEGAKCWILNSWNIRRLKVLDFSPLFLSLL